jgi:hypothetical protein
MGRILQMLLRAMPRRLTTAGLVVASVSVGVLIVVAGGNAHVGLAIREASAAPGLIRVAKPTRRPDEVIADLERRLDQHDDARRRNSETAMGQARASLKQGSEAAIQDLEGQLRSGTTMVYWAAVLAGQAADTGNQDTMDRARRYLQAAGGTAAAGQGGRRQP